MSLGEKWDCDWGALEIPSCLCNLSLNMNSDHVVLPARMMVRREEVSFSSGSRGIYDSIIG